MCIDIVEICFGIAQWQISSIFDRVISQRHDNGGVLSFHALFWMALLIAIDKGFFFSAENSYFST